MTMATATHPGDDFFRSIERDDLDLIEATLSWQGDLLEVRHLAMGAVVSVGERAECTFFVPAADIGGSDSIELLAAGATELREDHPLEFDFGAFTIRLRVVPAGRHVPLGLFATLKQSAIGSVGLSFAVHAMIFGSLAMFLPSLGADDDDAIVRDRIATMQKYLVGAAERERERLAETSGDSSANESSAAGMQAVGESGAMGKPLAPKTNGHWSAKGEADPHEPTLSREQTLAEARDFGVLGMLASMALSDPNAPVVPWGSVLNGADRENHLGAMWGAEPAENWGVNGLGLSGVGESGCLPGATNCGQGVGVGDVGGLGRSLADRRGSCVGPNCDNGRGNGHAPVLGGHTAKAPIMRTCGERACGFESEGRIPPEVIQRIVRQNAGRYRFCYESALRNNPALTGHVRVKFVIDRGGAVSMAQDSSSDIPDERVRSCVVQSFYTLAFPAPEGGTVRVTYPIMFTPGE